MGADQAKADEALINLAEQIVGDDKYTAYQWAGIAVVIQIDPRRRLFGYVYLHDGTWVAAIPDLRSVLSKARELAEAMRESGKGTWKACLIQIALPGPSLVTEFEWDDPNRWDVNPANLERVVELLRPKK